MRRLVVSVLCCAAVLGCGGKNKNAGPNLEALGFAPELRLEPGDVIIANGRVIDGTGEPAREADVWLRGDRIMAVTELGDMFPAIVSVIDAQGKVVAPGFIDTHAHGDPLTHPEMQSFLAQGVTTILLGQDGNSVPVAELEQWFNEMEQKGIGVNVATTLGHGTLRDESGIGLSPSPTAEQLAALEAMCERGLQLGALGLSTGLEYQPGTFSRMEELEAVARPVGKRGLMVMSHVRSEDDDKLRESLNELVEQCRRTGARAHVSHLKSVYGKGAARAEEILGYLQQARGTGVTVTADLYPYTASYTGIGLLFPDYALPPNDYTTVAEQKRNELLDYLDRRVARRNGPEATLFGSGKYAGKTLAQVAEEQGRPYAEVLLEAGPDSGSAAYFIMDEELQARLLVDPAVNICSDGSPTMRHPRGHGSFARVIRKFVVDEERLTLEQAIHKMSGLSAQHVGLDALDRGTLTPGSYADVVIFDPNMVEDTATYTSPFQLAKGFDTIFVNGVLIRQNGEFSAERMGRALRRSDSDSLQGASPSP